MTREQLQDRISKKEQDIQKIERRIAKWAKGLRPEDIAVCVPFGDCIYGTAPRNVYWKDYHGTPEYQAASKAYNEYVDSRTDIPSSTDWSKGPNINELRSAYRDLGEARYTLAKYQDELKNLDKFDSEEKVEVIWNFLMNWKELAREWYLRNAEKYFELKKGYKEAHDKMMAEYDGKPSYYTKRDWESQYWRNIDSLTKEITHIKGQYEGNSWDSPWIYTSYTVDEEMLNKALDKEVKAKYQRLIAEITEITGEITDASGLSIGGKGDINGTITGVKGTANVNTFSAGGWNIQCFHYRTKITRVK